MNEINFTALPINKVNIKKYDKKTKNFINYPANFVRLVANDRNDINAVNKCAQQWKNADFIDKIATAAHWIGYRNGVEINVYALTTQKNNLKKLNPQYILGLAEIRTDNENPQNTILYHLQVKPSAINVHNKDNKSYKKVGTSIVKSLQKQFKNISLFSIKDTDVENFYKNLGFIEDYFGEKHFTWSSNILKRLKVRFDKFKLDLMI